MIPSGLSCVDIQNDKPICVLGIASNTAGLKIAEKMLGWLDKVYQVVRVYHDGKQFEYPAIAKAQELSIEHNCPVLYIHTRGAYHLWATTKGTHKVWKREFGDNFQKYFDLVNTKTPTVATLFWDNSGKTWYNGFVANPEAWKAIPKVKPNKDRYFFEELWKGNKKTTVIGSIINDPNNNRNSDIKRYLKNVK